MSPTWSTSEHAARLERELRRSVVRSRNGLRVVLGASGPRVGATPKDVVWRRGRAELWRYRNETVRYGPPVLVVFSLVSRSYILDLRPSSSAIEFLLAQGLDVFMLDWGVPDERDAGNDLATYVDDYLPRAVAAVLRETRSAEVTLAGYCLGGNFAALYAAGHEDAPVRNLILMATPADYRQMGAMVAPVLEGRVDTDDVIDETGNVPADVLYGGFFMQAPTIEVARYATLLDKLWNDDYVEGWQAMAQWSRDHVPFPGAVYRDVVERFVRRNELMSGAVRLRGREIRLAEANGEVLNAFAEADNVVPAAAAEPNSGLVGRADHRHELRLGGGHVTFAVGKRAFGQTLPALAGWIVAHSEQIEGGTA